VTEQARRLRIKGLSKVYAEAGRRHSVLHALDLEVEAGQTLALVGRSGSGKTTLLNLISGIELPDSGEVWVGSTCLTALGERERTLFRRRHLGFVFQFFNLIPTLTVAENVLLPLELSGRVDAARRARARGLLEEVGLAGRSDSYPDRLSGGEQQRVAVVRAVVHEPTLLLADEPTGNLDEESGQAVLDLFGSLVRAAGTTAVMVTHSREVAALADRVYRMRDGRVEPEAPEARGARAGRP